MRSVPPYLPIITIAYALFAFFFAKSGVWRKEYRQLLPRWGRSSARIGGFMAMGVLLLAVWSFILLTTPAPATGDPRWRGGMSPAEQKELIK